MVLRRLMRRSWQLLTAARRSWQPAMLRSGWGAQGAAALTEAVNSERQRAIAKVAVTIDKNAGDGRGNGPGQSHCQRFGRKRLGAGVKARGDEELRCPMLCSWSVLTVTRGPGGRRRPQRPRGRRRRDGRGHQQ